MKIALKHFAIFILLLSVQNFYAQKSRFVEEIALYHFNNLVTNKINPGIKRSRSTEIKYYTNGEVSKSISAEGADYRDKDTLIFKNPFEHCKIVNQKDLEKFKVPNTFKNDGFKYLLKISHYLKKDNKYYVDFYVKVDSHEDYFISLVLNLNGDLINYSFLGGL